ncbi:hypothetical protein DR64_3893 [Paraburkholderia xenovorans LB400]|nr:hypothetical protein DR64_3893 [Paraburkholderia xenovorans LB400]
MLAIRARPGYAQREKVKVSVGHHLRPQVKSADAVVDRFGSAA